MSCSVHSFQIATIQSEEQNAHSKSAIKSHFMLGFIWSLTMKRPNTPRSTPPLKLWDFSSDIFVVSSKWDHSVRIAIQMSLINYSISASLELEPSCAVKWVGSRMFILRKYPWLQMKWFKYLERTLHGCSVMWKTMAFTKNTMAWLRLSCEGGRRRAVEPPEVGVSVWAEPDHGGKEWPSAV